MTKTRISLATLAALTWVASSQATLLFYESFEGTNFVAGSTIDTSSAAGDGTLSNSVGAVGQSGNWLYSPISTSNATYGTGHTVNISNATAMSYSGGSVAVNGGSKYLQASATAGSQTFVAGVNLSSAITHATIGAGNYVWVGGLIRTSGSMAFGDHVSIGLKTGSGIETAGNVTARVGVGGSNQFFTSINGSAASGTTASVGTTYFVVARFLTNGTQWTDSDMWFNPTTLVEGSLGTPIQSFVGSTQTGNFSAFAINVASIDNNDGFAIDEIRIGTSYADIVAVPEPSSLAAIAGLCMLGFAVIRRRRA